MKANLVTDLRNVGLKDVAIVGGKNASLGELITRLQAEGVRLPGGFATTAEAYWKFLSQGQLKTELIEILSELNPKYVPSIERVANKARAAILAHELPEDLKREILNHFDLLCAECGREPSLAVRSSATAEDLPGVSFAGQHATFLNVRGQDELITAVHHCYASLFMARAIDYRIRNGFDHMNVALSVGIQQMVRSDLGSSGVIFTLDTESGFRDVVLVSGSYGLGETVVQGQVNPDEWTVFKPTLDQGFEPIIDRRLGTKEIQLIFEANSGGTRLVDVQPALRTQYCLTDSDVVQLARWACAIESHYSKEAGHLQPMDIEWAKDGQTGEMFILQARPETVHGAGSRVHSSLFELTGRHGEPLVTGQAVGSRIASGPVRIVLEPSGLSSVKPGDILVARNTDPDWEPVMKTVAGIVTDQGGRTAHAAIVSREIGVPCIVGAGDATTALHDGQLVTVCCSEGSEGHVYADAVKFTKSEVYVTDMAETKTKIMVNVGDPGQAFNAAALPCAGVGLARMEFIINTSIGIHPMALRRYPHLKDASAVAAIATRLNGMEPCEFFVQRLSEGLAKICAAFYPRPVIVRTSDFKTNEYASLTGGAEFEPVEENPMLGFRGASRYYDPRYAEGFELECRALRRVREEMGLKNLKIMIPFCRTVQEAKLVLQSMSNAGLKQHDNGLEVYVMCELPSNVIDADEFLKVFDGYSIGSNDLTQLALGVDRDSGTISHLFNEQDATVKALIAQAIRAARRHGRPIGICGQAPSDYPEFAQWLVERGITSISVNADAFVKTVAAVAEAEASLTSRANLQKQEAHVK